MSYEDDDIIEDYTFDDVDLIIAKTDAQVLFYQWLGAPRDCQVVRHAKMTDVVDKVVAGPELPPAMKAAAKAMLTVSVKVPPGKRFYDLTFEELCDNVGRMYQTYTFEIRE